MAGDDNVEFDDDLSKTITPSNVNTNTSSTQNLESLDTPTPKGKGKTSLRRKDLLKKGLKPYF